MKRVAYISNYEVPYRVVFFNQLSQHCDLTVVYERNTSAGRDAVWAKSVNINYKTEYLGGPFAFFHLAGLLFGGYDAVIFGCYNSLVQMFAIFAGKLFKKDYYLNIDGEAFIEGNSFKCKIKRYFIRGASRYLIAGETASRRIQKKLGLPEHTVFTYHFSSLTDSELKKHELRGLNRDQKKGDHILVVGLYKDYKGLDIAVEAAKKSPDIQWKFIGTGDDKDRFIREQEIDKYPNISVISFLQTQDLELEYLACSALVLPSRQECWGLVINEAASFGTPVVSTYGSGAAIEFLSGYEFGRYLATPCDHLDLLKKVRLCLDTDNREYSLYLLDISKRYSIENMVREHMDCISV